MKSKYTVFALILLFITLTARGQVIYVTPSGAGAYDGTSWADAYGGGSLQSVVGTAPYGAQVWVAAGTYLPAVAGRDTAFDIGNGVKVYGGFAGTETLLTERDYETNVTILSGDVGVPGDLTDNSYHVVHFTNSDATTTLDGFTVEYGCAYDSTAEWGTEGGGILNTPFGSAFSQSNPVIRNCIIQNNRAKNSGGGMADVSMGGYNNAYIVKCSFLNNNAHNSDTSANTAGGGLAFISESLIGSYSQNVTSTVDSCVFNGNYAGSGGGIYVSAGDAFCSPTIKNSLIENNTAVQGGGITSSQQYIYYGGNIQLTVSNCHITNNHARLYYGGGIYISYFTAWGGDVTIDSSLIDSNTSGISMVNNNHSNTYTQIRNTHIVSNGDSIIWGTNELQFLDDNNSSDTFLVSNSVIYTQVPGYNGSLPAVHIETNYSSAASVTFENCTLYKDNLPSNVYPPVQISNRVDVGIGTGGPSTISLSLLNSILYCNSSSYTAVENSGSGISVYTENSLLRNTGGSAAWTGVGTDGGGNLDAYPYFRDTAHADLHLSCGSPAFNHGNNTLVPSSLITDFDGTARIKYGIVDMGAYEADTTTFTGPVAAPVVHTGSSADTFISIPTGSMVDSMRWDFGDGATSTLDTAGHHYAAAGSYTVCLHLYNHCGTTDSCFALVICGVPPVASFTHTGTAHQAFNYTGTAIAIDSVVWNYGDGSRDTGLHPTHNYMATGTYTVCATVYTACGSDSACQSIHVIVTGIKGLSSFQDLNIYPNPASGILTIDNAPKGTTIRLFNIIGQQVYSSQLINGHEVIDVHTLPAGNYIMQLTDADGNRMNRAFTEK